MRPVEKVRKVKSMIWKTEKERDVCYDLLINLGILVCKSLYQIAFSAQPACLPQPR